MMVVPFSKRDDLSSDDYHSFKKIISRSGIMEYRKSPYHFLMNVWSESKPTKEPTPAMTFGSAFHTYMLENDKFFDEYAIKPEPVLLKDTDRDTYNAYKAEVAQLELSEKTVISQADYSLILEMGYRIGLNEQAQQLINGAVYERSYFWVDKDSEIGIKARPDILHSNMIVDLKTCADASPRGFQRAIVDGGYHIQGAMIRDAVRAVDGRDISNVIFLAIEKSYPYCIGIYILDEYALDQGEREYKQILIALKHNIANNLWPCYDVQTISLPRWAINE